jgi:hypothetical protein
MDMFRTYILRKKSEEEKKEKKEKKETIKKGTKEKGAMKCGPWEDMLLAAEKKLEEESKKKNNIKIVCENCGQQQYFCVCIRNL